MRTSVFVLLSVFLMLWIESVVLIAVISTHWCGTYVLTSPLVVRGEGRSILGVIGGQFCYPPLQ